MTLKVSIIGAGIGAQHLSAFLNLPERFSVHSLCDLDLARAEEVSAGRVPTRSDFEAILQDPSVDIVDICLPPHLHFKAIEAALSAGKAVICEKPLVGSLAEVDALEKLVQGENRIFPVFQYRYGRGMAELRALLDAGLAGHCHAATLETHWQRNADYYEIDWRGTWAGEQGGAILGHAIHIHDLLGSVLGPIERIYAELATRVNTIEVEDCAALSIRMADGTPVTSSVTLGAAGNISRARFLFQGFTAESDHAPYAPAAKPWRFTARFPEDQPKIDAVLADLGEVLTGYEGLFTAIADALAGQGGREVTLADARRSLEFVTAVYASSRSGAAVQLPLGPEHALYDGWVPSG